MYMYYYFDFNLNKYDLISGDWDYERHYSTNHVEDDDDDYSGCYQGDSEDQYIVIDDDADVDESEMLDDYDVEQDDMMRQVSIMVPTGTGNQGKPGKMGRHFPVREFCQYWKSQGILPKILEKQENLNKKKVFL